MPELVFNPEERRRLAKVCQALGTTFEEFVHHATMQAVDEMEGISQEIRRGYQWTATRHDNT